MEVMPKDQTQPPRVVHFQTAMIGTFSLRH